MVRISNIIEIVIGVVLIVLAFGLFHEIPNSGDDVVFYIFFMIFAGFGGFAFIADSIENLIKNKK